MSMTEEEKALRKARREAKKEAEKQAEHEEFLMLRERFRSNAPYTALQLLARANEHLLVHTKVVEESYPGEWADKNYLRVQMWTGDEELELELDVWEGVAETREELNLRQWNLQAALDQFERYEEKVNAERLRQKKRHELLERLTKEERELLGV